MGFESYVLWQNYTISAPKAAGRARHSVRAGLGQADDGAHGGTWQSATRPTFTPLKKK